MINTGKKLQLDFYNQGLTEPFFGCALEKTLCESNSPYLMAISMGESIQAGRDITYANHYIEGNALNIPFVRYMGTGGPVYTSAGLLKVAGLVPKGMSDLDSVCKMVADIYTRLGIDTDYVEGTNDIKIQGKKVSGVTHGTPLGDYDYVGFFFSLYNDYERAAQAMKLTKHTTNLSDRAAGIHETHPDITKEQIIEAVKLELISRGFELKDVAVNKDKQLVDRVAENELGIFRNESFIKRAYVDKP